MHQTLFLPSLLLIWFTLVGIERAKTEDYAFFMEPPYLDYTLQQNCDLQQVGGVLNDKGWLTHKPNHANG